MTDIDSFSADAYARGVDPIDQAASIIESTIEFHAMVVVARAKDPAAFPAWKNAPLTQDALARRIIAGLLNAGWTPPSAERIRERTRQRATELRESAARLRETVAQLRAGNVSQWLIDSVGADEVATEEQRRRLADGLERGADESERRADDIEATDA